MIRILPPATLPLAALLLAPAPLHAQQPLTDPAQLDRLVEAFTGAAQGQPGGAREPVHRRLRLRVCGADPQAGWHGAPGRTVVLACPDAGGWRVYVNLVPDRAAGASAPQANAVKRGDSLTVSVTGRGFAVRRPAEALESGAVGDWIAVRTATGGDPVRAQIVQPGLAEIPLQ